MSKAIGGSLPGIDAHGITGGGGGDTRMILRRSGAEVKFEISPVTRGTVFAPRLMRVSEVVEDAFGFAEVPARRD